MISKTGEVHRGSHEIAGELFEPLGIGGIDGGSVVNAKTGIPPRQEQVDALLGDELAVSEKSQDLVPEDELGLVGIDIRDGMPRGDSCHNLYWVGDEDRGRIRDTPKNRRE